MERPILFSGEMVRAIRDGRKTQTRRVVKPQIQAVIAQPGEGKAPSWAITHGPPKGVGVCVNEYGNEGWLRCPYGQPGDRLWVREAWQAWAQTSYEYDEWEPWSTERRRGLSFSAYRDEYGEPGAIEYRATSESGGPWTPSIHMPRWACRLVLEITDVRVERLHEITEADAAAEGVEVDMLCDILRPDANRAKELPPLHWIGGGNEEDDLCPKCAPKRLRKLIRAGGDKEELFVDGGWGYEADSHRFCEDCGQQLDVGLTDYGTKEEIAHFAEHGITSADDARDFLDMLDSGNPRLTKACGELHYLPELAGPIARIGYRYLWGKLNRARGYGWDVNPWVWVITFKPVPAV